MTANDENSDDPKSVRNDDRRSWSFLERRFLRILCPGSTSSIVDFRCEARQSLSAAVTNEFQQRPGHPRLSRDGWHVFVSSTFWSK